ncbi:hypothetical protein [Rhizobium laguerreae]|uniref:hypothetical protein n=1 Tax=Rhizobium laguerreae TaxID=1076926 RepID=UPI001C929EC8|nr:hypothetical protein [Rhizobium laguerreae]MBY3378961.1 hypothetical protein [Rhizobium laguerreae]
MLEQRLVDYLIRKKRGTVRPVPDDFSFATPDRPAAGRFILPGITPDDDPGLTFEEANGRYDVAFEPPKPCLASRNIALKSTSSVRGHFVDVGRNRVLSFESVLEYLMGNILVANSDTILVEDQPPELAFEFDGEKRQTIDFRATNRRRFRIGYAVKAADQLERDMTMRKAKAIAAVHVPTFADKILVCTEFEITKDLGWNAVDINDARQERCQKDCDRVLEFLLGVGKPIEIWRVQDKLDDESGVWNALLCLHHDRLVQIERPDRRFTDAALVTPVTRH